MCLGSTKKKLISQCSYLGDVSANFTMEDGDGDGELPDRAATATRIQKGKDVIRVYEFEKESSIV